ncbi:MAG: hypothetical protein L0Z62_42415 [Gemmataceae bacterium]|nr:hypothetical protein [Gemmataceae bacterium]
MDRVEIRITRSLTVIRYLFEELNAGRVPTIRSVFETGRQDHTQDPQRVAGVVRFRAERELSVFGPEASSLPEEDRPKYGFAYFEGSPTEPYPFGPVCFVLNLDRNELRERITFTPVDSSIPGLGPEEVGTLDHPLNAFARSSGALRATGLIPLDQPIPEGCRVRDNLAERTPEAQVWGPLCVIPDHIRGIMMEVLEEQGLDIETLRSVAERQGIPLRVQVIRRGG